MAVLFFFSAQSDFNSIVAKYRSELDANHITSALSGIFKEIASRGTQDTSGTPTRGGNYSIIYLPEFVKFLLPNCYVESIIELVYIVD